VQRVGAVLRNALRSGSRLESGRPDLRQTKTLVTNNLCVLLHRTTGRLLRASLISTQPTAARDADYKQY